MPGLADILQDESFQLGQRIHVWGGSCSGKSTVAENLANAMDMPFVELDALNWLPNWTDLTRTDPDRFVARMTDATKGDRWIVAGGYTTYSSQVFWPRLDTLIWLDIPVQIRIYRVIVRSWRRWRTNELLWGTN